MTIINTAVNTIASTVDVVNNALNGALNNTTRTSNEDAELRAAIERTTMERNAQATGRAIDAARDQLANQVRATALEQTRPGSSQVSGSIHFIDSAEHILGTAANVVRGEPPAAMGLGTGTARPPEASAPALLGGGAAQTLGGPGGSARTDTEVPVTLGARLGSNPGASNVGSHPNVDLQIGSSVAAAPAPGQLEDSAGRLSSTMGGGRVAAFGPSMAADSAAAPGSPMRPASERTVAEAQVARQAAALAGSNRIIGEGDAAREMQVRARDLPSLPAGETASRPTAEGGAAPSGRAEGGGERIGRLERVERWDGAASTSRPDPTIPVSMLDRGANHGQSATDVAATIEHAEHAAPTPSTMTDAAADPAFSIQPASEHALAQAQITRRAAAIALAYRTFGEVDAAREMRARTRDLPPVLAGEVMAAARATVEGIVSAFGRAGGGGERIGRVERVERWDGAAANRRPEASAPELIFDRSTRHGQIATDLAATVEHVGRGRRGEPIAHDTAALILDGLGQGDEYRLSLFALGIPFGTGLMLPLALADELAQRGDQRRKRQLLAATEQGLRRLQERIAATVGALVELTLPLAGFLSTQPNLDAGNPDQVAALLREYAARHPHFLREFEAALRRVDAVGSDVFFALEALARQTPTRVELQSVRNDLLTSPATAFAIAQSASAQDAVIDRSKAGDQPQGEEGAAALTTESARRIYATLGFSPAWSALLAAATVTWHRAGLLDPQRVASDSSRDRNQQSRAIEALLRFFGAAWGLPLFRSLEQRDWL